MARVLLAAAAGAAGMYLLDPGQGARRRALLRDRLAALRLAWRRNEPTDAQLVERVRGKLRRWVSHPRAVEVVVDSGCVRLNGAVLDEELQRVVRAVRRVRGVRRIEGRLTAYSSTRGMLALQGGVPSWGERPGLLQRRWSPAARVLVAAAAAAGAALLLSRA
jgi:hypothetical protein